MDLLNLDEEKFKTVTLHGYIFKIKHISMQDEIEINRRRNKLQNGASIESLTEVEFNLYSNIAIVDICVEETPKEFKELQFSSCIAWDNKELIFELVNEITKHTDDLKSKLKKNRPIN